MKLLTILISSLVISLGLAQTVPVITEDWKPYIDSNASNLGFATEIIDSAFSKAGMSADISWSGNWSRVSADIDGGLALSYAWFFNTERDEKWFYSEPFIAPKQALMVRKDSNISITSLEDMRPYWIGTTAAYSYGQTFDNYKVNLQIDEANTDLTNMKKLLRGRVDIFAIDPFVGAAMLQDHFSEEERNELMMILDTPFEEAPLHLVCGKTMPDCQFYLSKFNEGLAIMREDGSLEAIINQALSSN